MLTTKLEAILFAIAKPIALTQLQKQFGVSAEVMDEAIEAVRVKYNTSTSGIHLFETNGQVQFVINPKISADVAGFLKKEASGPLSRPTLETLAVIAYRGPVTKPEIEQVRGVNCSLILRNLLIRGLIEEQEDAARLQPVYSISIECLKELGLHRVEDLDRFEEFHSNQKIQEL